MAYNSAFSPCGPTYLVGNQPVQVNPSSNQMVTSYRIRNLQTSAKYISWAGPVASGNAPSFPSGVPAPAAGAPAPQTLGLLGTSVEVFSNMPSGAWFISTDQGNFEVTPGEGL